MSRPIALFFGLVLASSPYLKGAVPVGYGQASLEMTIDGVASGAIYSLEGGERRATVNMAGSSSTGLSKKSVTDTTYTPITVRVSLPLAPPILSWIAAFCENLHPTKSIVVARYDYSGKQVGETLEGFNTTLSEVRFPSFDGASRSFAYLTLVLIPESSKISLKAVTRGPTTTKILAMEKYFRFKIDGLDATKVVKIDAFSIRQAIPSGGAEGNSEKTESGSTVFPNLVLTFPSPTSDWRIWRDDFLVKGNNGDAAEKGGSLEMLSSDQFTSLLTLQLSHLGLVRLSDRVSPGSDGVSEIELYCEAMTPTTLAPVPGKGPTETPSPGPARTPPSPTAPTPSTPSPPLNNPVVSPLNGPASPLPTVQADSTPGPINPLGPPTPADSNPDGAGAGGLTDFPRPEDAVQLSDNVYRNLNNNQEHAVYSAKSTLDQTASFYAKSLPADGWSEVTHVENSKTVGEVKQIVMTWKKGSRTAGITVLEVKSGGVEIRITMSTLF